MSVLTAVPAANDMTRMRLFSSFIKRFIPSQMFQNLSPHEFHEALIASKNAVLIDVRTPSEFQAGHIPGAVNIDIMSPHFSHRVTTLDPSATYFVNCQSGGRSARACTYLMKQGIEAPVNLKGGMIAWMAAKKPIE